MKKDLRIDTRLRLEARKLRTRLLSLEGSHSQSGDVYALWLGELSALGAKVGPRALPGLQPASQCQ